MEHFGRAHYSLIEVQNLIRKPSSRLITHSATLSAANVGYLSDFDIVNRCLALKQSEIFKTMTSDVNPTLWQDVYRSQDPNGMVLYIKLQIKELKDGTKGVIISFKEADN
ncbi:MAG: type II toxin-antitoxin system MqsR family toxin [Chitinivibrionales bacterium]|nr:type II toxin-antitoxin system MqsR family toxin [Chitinivibrionales bacterium]